MTLCVLSACAMFWGDDIREPDTRAVAGRAGDERRVAVAGR